jgi:hypothetical protein
MDRYDLAMLCGVILFFALIGCLVLFGYSVYHDSVKSFEVSGVLQSVRYNAVGDKDLVVIGGIRYTVILCNSRVEVNSMIGKAVNLSASGVGGRATLCLIGEVE